MKIKNIEDRIVNNFNRNKKQLSSNSLNEFSFDEMLKSKISNVEKKLHEDTNYISSNNLNELRINNKNSNFTENLLELEKYSIGLKTLISVKNKVVSFYKEIMNMQI